MFVFLSIVLSPAGCKNKQKSVPASKAGDIFENTIGMKLAYIPQGSFLMGSPADEKGRQQDEFQHKVTISRPFRVSTTEVTQVQWRTVMDSDAPCNFKGDDLPVEKVSWRSAVLFCKKLSEKEGATYRLPTEAEWEFACRAGAKGQFSGTGKLDDMGWYSDNSDDKTHPVGQKRPNACGLYDVHGNVSEWCSDYYNADYPQTECTDPNGSEKGKYRVIRGGSWSHFGRSARCSARSSAPESYQFIQTGFRVVMEVAK